MNEKIENDINKVKKKFVQEVKTQERDTTAIIERIEKNSHDTIENIRRSALELEHSLKIRMDDCETLVKSRINETYVKTLGKQIESNIIDSFDNKNRRTISEIKEICNGFSRHLEQSLDSSGKEISSLKSKLETIERELGSKIKKQEITNLKAEFDDQHKFLESKLEVNNKTLASMNVRLDSYNSMVRSLRDEMKQRDEAIKKIPPNVSQ